MNRAFMSLPPSGRCLLLLLVGAGAASASSESLKCAISPVPEPAKTATEVVVSCVFSEPRLIPETVEVLQVDGTESVPVGIFRLHEDGQGANHSGGSRTFAGRVKINRRRSAGVHLQVSAAIRGQIRRVRSDVLTAVAAPPGALDLLGQFRQNLGVDTAAGALQTLAVGIARIFGGAAAAAPNPQANAPITFDNLQDGDVVGSLVPNCQFTNAIVLTAGVSLNEFEAPPHSSPNVAVDANGPIAIAFSPPIFGFSGYFTYSSPLSIAAFDAAGNPVASAASTFANNFALSGVAGSSPNEFIQVGSSTAIAGITLTGSPAGSSFVVDDIQLSTSAVVLPSLSVTKSHRGNLTQGQTNAAYTVTVSNHAGAGPASGAVTVTEAVPLGLTLVLMAGTGWTCPSGSTTCTRSDPLAAGASYPAITVTVNVASDAPSQLTNQVTVSGGGSNGALASDPATIAGVTVSGPQALRFVPVTPCRVADTRNPTGPFGGPALAAAISHDFNIPASPCGIAANALAYSLNLTVVPIGPLGFLSVWPAGQSQPVVSTLNSGDGRIKANAAIVPAGVNGAVTVFASDPSHVIVDINGYFVPASGVQNLAFYPLTPCRIVDTRLGTGAFAGPALAPGVARNFPVPSSLCGIPADAQAYALNTTVVPTGPLGFLSVWPAGSPQPGSSTLNAPTGVVTANAAIVPAGVNGAITVIATNPTDLIIDINGYFAPPGGPGALQFFTVTPCRILDTRGPAGPFGGPQMDAAVARSFAVPASSCSIPPTAQAYSLNATVVPVAGLGFLSLWGAGPQPVVSTLNAGDGRIVANAAIVPAGVNGAVNGFASNATQLILDINGYFVQ